MAQVVSWWCLGCGVYLPPPIETYCRRCQVCENALRLACHLEDDPDEQ
jgi:hypothetical protein